MVSQRLLPRRDGPGRVPAFEVMVANAARRALSSGEDEVVPRICDLEALPASTAGKVEIETLEEGRDNEIIEHLIRSAVLTVFKDMVDPASHRAVLDAFDEGAVVSAGDDIASADYVALLEQIPALTDILEGIGIDEAGRGRPAVVASAVEFVLEGLHLNKRLNKEAVGGAGVYRARA